MVEMKIMIDRRVLHRILSEVTDGLIRTESAPVQLTLTIPKGDLEIWYELREGNETVMIRNFAEILENRSNKEI